MKLKYHVVDVFTKVPLEGNALAVFVDADELDTATMQQVARELNLSETTFIIPRQSTAKATRVRIFTPSSEMQFAGHPTIGTAFVMRELGLVSKTAAEFSLNENVGLVPVRVDLGGDPLLWLKTPPITREGAYDRARCAAALSLTEDDLLANAPCELYTAGNPIIFVPLKDPDTVDRADVDSPALRDLLARCEHPTCVFPFAPTKEGAYSRMFAQELGIMEDPATGSATGPLAAYMMNHGLVASADGTRFISEQGTKMGRRSILHVLVHGERGSSAIEVGGNVTPLVLAELTLPAPSAIPA